MKIIKNPGSEVWSDLIKRPTPSFENIEKTVNQIFADIQRNGDAAVQKYTAMFDGVENALLEVSEEERLYAADKVSSPLKEAIKMAKENIEVFHKAQKTEAIKVETRPGVVCWQEKRAIEKIGLYIPGGTAPLFSTVLMLAVPAQLAGCKEIVLCTPPNSQGEIANEILYAASLCGITKIFKVGGIQAIAAFTFGTQSIPQVYKIFGPGNQFVTVAKQVATRYGVAIDMPAGPSEVLVIADDTAVASFVAADLLSQAEHGPDSQVILISKSTDFIKQVERELAVQINDLPRKSVVEKTLENSKFIQFSEDGDALKFINAYAPEHLIICSKNEEFFVAGIQNAGSVFIGNYTPESAGDYASGTNHTLPTNGFSKAYSGVGLDSFLKSMTFQKISKHGIQNIGTTIELMAEAEGLQAHKNAVSIRLKTL